MMIRQLPFARGGAKVHEPVACDHRTVSKDGRIVCRKIAEGDAGISPDLCRGCPFRASNCQNLRFSLRKTSPSPLVVRFNGRTEVWDDDPPELHFRQAACAAKVLPIESPRACVGCAQRKPIEAPETARFASPAPRRAACEPGKVVPIPRRESVPAAVASPA